MVQEIASFAIFTAIILLLTPVTSFLALLGSIFFMLSGTIKEVLFEFTNELTGERPSYGVQSIPFLISYIFILFLVVIIGIILSLPFLWFVHIKADAHWLWFGTQIVLLSGLWVSLSRWFSHQRDLKWFKKNPFIGHLALILYWLFVNIVGVGISFFVAFILFAV